MVKSSLTNILGSFTEEEIKAFEKFVDSPYFNTSEATAKLFKEIRKFYPEFLDKDFTKECLYERVYGKKLYNEGLLRKLVSNLIKLTADFLKIHGKLESKEFELNLLKEYSRRSLFNHFEKRANELIDQINSNKLSALNSIEFLADVEFVRSDTYYTFEIEEKSLTEFHNFAEHYLSTVQIKLLSYAMKLFISKGFHHKPPKNPLDKFVSNINWEESIKLVKNDAERTLVEFYMRMYILYKDPSDYENFLKLKKYLFSGKILIERTLLASAVTHLESYCSFHYDVNKNLKMIDQLVEIYEFSLSQKLYFRNEKGYMPVNYYRNYLIMFLPNRVDLVERLLTECISDIDPEHKKNIEEYTKMFIHYRKKNFENSLKYLNNIDLLNFSFKNDVKSTLIKIHFELGNYEQVYAAVDSFKHIIKDERKSERFTSEIKKFLDCVLILTRSVSKKNIDELRLLRSKLDLSKFNYGILWLKDKADQHLKSM